MFDKFMCFCSGNDGDLKKKAADATAQIEELTAKLKSEEAEKVQLGQDLIGHKKDREAAEGDIEEATTLREKEASEFAAEKADSETNIAAMAKAIPALEKGMGGAALLQMPSGSRLRKIVESYPNVDASDRRDVVAFLQENGDYAPASGQIVGILKAMKDDMEAELKEAVETEAKAVAGYTEIKTSKEKEIEMATEAIETKMARAGELAVSVVQTKDALEDEKEELADTQKFIATLKRDCATKEKDFAERSKLRAEEVSAISDAIGILNDDDALDVFKKAMPSALLQATGFLQKADGKASRGSKAVAILSSKATSVNMKLLLFSMSIKLKSKSLGGFDEVMKMIDDMVVLLGKQTAEDEKQKAWCEGEFEKAADEEAASKTKLGQTDAELAELTDKISELMEEISALGSGIAALDKSVAEATEMRKEQHAEYVSAMQLNEVAVGLVEKAKNRMQKFYNPTLYKAAPKTERTMEQKIIDAGTFAQLHRRSDVAPPPAPEMPTGAPTKNAKSAGVLSMMDTIVSDLKSDMKDSEYEEKTAQTEYAELMGDSQETRAGDVKALTGKETTKATTEEALTTAKETRSATAIDLKQVQTVIGDLHVSCDFIMQNFDLRKEARANEVEGLKNAKAVLSGASFSF